MLQPLLTRLDELEKSATKAPWESMILVRDGHDDFVYGVGCHYTDNISDRYSEEPFTLEAGAHLKYSKEDADLIAELRNAYPLLRAEIERLQEVERKYEEMRK